MSIWSTDIGKRGEKLAARYLKKQGFKILETNRHESHKEIDIIASDATYLLFVEVKTRSCGREMDLYFTPAMAVHRDKQRKTIWAAQRYLSKHPELQKQPRMDVIEVYLEKETKKLLKLNHIPNAFGK